MTAPNLVIFMVDPITPFPTRTEKNKSTEIVELDIPIQELNQARFPSNFKEGLAKEQIATKTGSSKRQDQAEKNNSFVTTPAMPSIDIRHPVITFIDELTTALRESSDKFLRPPPSIGISTTVRKEIDLSDLLIALENGEKRLGLISQSRPSFDTLAIASRHLAHDAAFMVRGLRRHIITTNTDPAHPSEQKSSAVFESVDNLEHRLHEMKLKFEDMAAELFIHMQIEAQGGRIN